MGVNGWAFRQRKWISPQESPAAQSPHHHPPRPAGHLQDFTTRPRASFPLSVPFPFQQKASLPTSLKTSFSSKISSPIKPSPAPPCYTGRPSKNSPDLSYSTSQLTSHACTFISGPYISEKSLCFIPMLILPHWPWLSSLPPFPEAILPFMIHPPPLSLPVLSPSLLL